MVSIFRNLALGFFIVLFCLTPGASSEITPKASPSKFLRAEHDQIYATLERLSQTPGRTGKAAKKLSLVLRPHMIKEESFVLPQLGVLKDLAFGKIPDHPAWIVERSEKLKENYPQMIADHKAIRTAVNQLMEAAKLDGESSALIFAAHLEAHLQDEDEIIYPAAILAGDFFNRTKAGTQH